MPQAILDAPAPMYVPMLGLVMNPDESYDISEAQAQELANHPLIKVTPGTSTGAVVPPAAPVVPEPAPVNGANQPPQTALSDEAANESEAS